MRDGRLWASLTNSVERRGKRHQRPSMIDLENQQREVVLLRKVPSPSMGWEYPRTVTLPIEDGFPGLFPILDTNGEF